MKKKYSSTLQRNVSVFLVVMAALTAGVWLYGDFTAFRQQMANLRDDYEASQKAIMVKQVEHALDYIRFQRSVEEERLRNLLKTKIHEAYGVATYLYEKNKGEDRAVIERIVRDTLVAIRWKDGSGYYFAFDTSGKTCFHPMDQPGTNLLGLIDANGKSFARDIIDLVQSKKEGFAEYVLEKPPGSGNFCPKVSYVKLFEPLGWILGSGEYLDDQKVDSQRLALRRLADVRFGKGEGYVFVLDSQGNMLLNEGQPDLAGRNVMHTTDIRGMKITPALLSAGKKPNDGFVRYYWRKPNAEKASPKLTYVREVPDWGWCVAAGLYMDDIDNVVAGRSRELIAGLKKKAGGVLVVLIVVLFVAHHVSKRIVSRAERDLRVFSSFFASAAMTSRQIDLDKLEFEEFHELGLSANEMIEERTLIEKEKEELNSQLVDASRRAGMADIATGVIHNVGNVLNSVGVTTSLALEHTRDSKIRKLCEAMELMEQHEDDIGAFMTEHPQGKHLATFLKQVSRHLENERSVLLGWLMDLRKNIEYIERIVNTQQSYAVFRAVEEKLYLKDLIEDAIGLREVSLHRQNVMVIRKHDDTPPVLIDKHKFMQVFLNLLSNAKHSIQQQKPDEGTITIQTGSVDQNTLFVEIGDNGVGISEDNMAKIFSYGFTTKKTGHGFGLHTSAVIANELGGGLTVSSEGQGKGATFRLELPLKRPESKFVDSHAQATP